MCGCREGFNTITMRLLVYGMLAVMVVDQVMANSGVVIPECGKVYVDKTVIEPCDFLTKPPRTEEYVSFLDRMLTMLSLQETAFKYMYDLRTVELVDPALSIGTPICQTEEKHITGYWKMNGEVLCVVVKPDRQNLIQVTCSREHCCNNSSRCTETGFITHRTLMYCDYYYDVHPQTTNIITDDAALVDFELLLGGVPNTDDEGYFAYKFTDLATTCSCKLCNGI